MSERSSGERVYGTRLGRNGALALWFVLVTAVIAFGVWAGRIPIVAPAIGFIYLVRTVVRLRISGDDVVLEKGFKIHRMKLSDLIAVRFAMSASGVELHTKHGDFDLAIGKKTKELIADLREMAPHVEISGFKGLYY